VRDRDVTVKKDRLELEEITLKINLIMSGASARLDDRRQER
jgi:hypothetical protein